MLINIIRNPIDTPYGYKNPDCGIALRGPLSQFFSGLYLKPLDDTISTMNVTYLRYQDDILILCNTKRQLNLESAVDRDFLAQQVDLDSVTKNFVVTLLVIRQFFV